MNKFQKEFLSKCKEVEFDDNNVPLLDTIFILPTNKKHESGYKVMYIAGFCSENDTYYLLDKYCDVVDIGDLIEGDALRNIHIDIQDNGIIQLWNRRQQFRSIFRLSSCTFEAVDRRNIKI